MAAKAVEFLGGHTPGRLRRFLPHGMEGDRLFFARNPHRKYRLRPVLPDDAGGIDLPPNATHTLVRIHPSRRSAEALVIADAGRGIDAWSNDDDALARLWQTDFERSEPVVMGVDTSKITPEMIAEILSVGGAEGLAEHLTRHGMTAALDSRIAVVLEPVAPWWRDNDRAWFAAHPGRKHRLREVMSGETDALAQLPRFPALGITHVLVHRLASGARVRAPLCWPYGGDTYPDDEHALTILWNRVTGSCGEGA